MDDEQKENNNQSATEGESNNSSVLRQRATTTSEKPVESGQSSSTGDSFQTSTSESNTTNTNSGINNQNAEDNLSNHRRRPNRIINPVVNNDITENINRFQIRCILFLCLAIGIGYLYLQLENQSMLVKPRLFPRSYGAFEGGKSEKQNSRKIFKSDSTLPSTPESDPTPMEDDPGPISTDFSKQSEKPMIDPNYEVQAKYLSKVLKTLGDLSRKMELNENITKPIGGIIEMRTELVEPEEKEDVPEYLKRLGSIIDDIKTSKEKAGEKQKHKSNPFLDSTKKAKLEAESEFERFKRKQKAKIKREKQRKKEWDKFMDDLLDAVYEEEQAERELKNKNERQYHGNFEESDEVGNLNSFNDIDDDENDEEEMDDDDDVGDGSNSINIKSEAGKNKKIVAESDEFEMTDEDYKQLEKRESYMQIRKSFEDSLNGADEIDTEDEEDDELYDDLDEEDDEPRSIFADNKEIQAGLALLQVMLEARNQAKAHQAKEEQGKPPETYEQKSSTSNKQDIDKINGRRRKSNLPQFEDDNLYTL